jgi:cell division transport system ATP-binding protein
MIQLFHVSKAFGTDYALKEISLRIRKGEFVFITGPSGAGKTTLLRLMFGAEQPTEGQILINGINLNRIISSKLIASQKTGLSSGLRSEEENRIQNVALAPSHGCRLALTRRKTRQMLRAVGLTVSSFLRLPGGAAVVAIAARSSRPSSPHR